MHNPDRGALPESLQALLNQFDQVKLMREQQRFEHTPTNAREALAGMTHKFVTDAPDIALVKDTCIAPRQPQGFAVPVRVYHPAPDQALPVLVFAHGGGHMAGSVSVYDAIARKLAIASRHIVVSVDYRLAPECPYPAGLTDLETVLRGVFSGLDRLGLSFETVLNVAGDSGGAAITASAAHRMADDLEIGLSRQVLIYPSLDYTLTQPSISELAVGYLLETDRIRWLMNHYLQDDENRREVSPLYMEIPAGFPRTLVITAQYCPLRDEGQAYVQRLSGAGIDASLLHFDDMIHAFLNLEDLVAEQCRQCYRAVGAFLNQPPRP